jgi:hypothetical protein
VKLPAVELDDELLGLEQRVHETAVHRDVGPGPGQVVAAAEV